MHRSFCSYEEARCFLQLSQRHTGLEHVFDDFNGLVFVRRAFIMLIQRKRRQLVFFLRPFSSRRLPERKYRGQKLTRASRTKETHQSQQELLVFTFFFYFDDVHKSTHHFQWEQFALLDREHGRVSRRSHCHRVRYDRQSKRMERSTGGRHARLPL